MKSAKIVLVLVLTFVLCNILSDACAQVQEELDMDYVYQLFEIESLSDPEVSEWSDAPDLGHQYIIGLGKFIKTSDLTLNISIDVKDVRARPLSNFIVSLGVAAIDLIKFDNTRSVTCLSSSSGKYSIGQYDIDIVFTAERNKKGKARITVNGDLLCEKHLDLSDWSSNDELHIGIWKAIPITVKHFYLKTEKFAKRKTGKISK